MDFVIIMMIVTSIIIWGLLWLALGGDNIDYEELDKIRPMTIERMVNSRGSWCKVQGFSGYEKVFRNHWAYFIEYSNEEGEIVAYFYHIHKITTLKTIVDKTVHKDWDYIRFKELEKLYKCLKENK